MALSALVWTAEGCATMSGSTATHDRVVRTYVERSKSDEWRFAASRPIVAAPNTVPSDRFPITIDVTRYHLCTSTTHAIVERSGQVGQLDEKGATKTNLCDPEPARDTVIVLHGSGGDVLAGVKTDQAGRAVIPLTAAEVFKAGPQISVSVGGRDAGAIDSLGYAHLADDERSWQAAQQTACETPTSEHGCEGVRRYLDAYPSGMHAEIAKDLIAKGEPKLSTLRARREAEDARLRAEADVTERQAERAGVTLTSMRIALDDPAIGAPSHERYMKINVDATVKKRQPPLTDVWVRASCLIGGKRMVDNGSALTNLGNLDPGETRRLEFAPFFTMPLAGDPAMCEVYLGTEGVGGSGFAIRRVCYVPGGAGPLKAGACDWPSP